MFSGERKEFLISMETFYKPYDECYSVAFNPRELWREGGFCVTVNGKLIVSGEAFSTAIGAIQCPVGIMVKNNDKVIVTITTNWDSVQETIMPGETKLINTHLPNAFILVSVSSEDNVGDNE